MTLISKTSFDLLDQLARNNTKDWYDAHKADIKTHCLAPFGEMLEHVSNRLMDSDRPLEGSAKTMFRMHRDVRFSKGKTPYKSSVSGVLTPSGTKAEMAGMVYVEMNASGGWVAGGFYKLPTAQLSLIRQRIIDEPDAFQTVLDGLSDAGTGLADMDRLTRMPKGFSEYEDHPFAEDIKRKSFIIRADVAMASWLNGDVTGIVADLACTVGPLVKFGKTALA
ncbi:DUF2461 domain-containing protein [Planktomarina temperata]|nr:DUF2461 domain-containing protein [Planktomarina temperata]